MVPFKASVPVTEMVPDVVVTPPAASIVRLPPVAVMPLVVTALLAVIDPDLTVPLMASAPPPVVLLNVTSPPLFNTIVEASVLSGPMLPVPLLRLIVAPVTVPVEVTVPVPFAVNVTELVPLTLAPSEMLPFVAEVDAIVRSVVEETTPVVVMLPFAFNVSAPLVAVNPVVVNDSLLLAIVPEPTVPLTASAVPAVDVFVIVVAPAVLSVITLV